MSAEPGRLYVIAAPSGAGKTSLVKALMEREPRLRFSVSYTTRKPRANEIDGRDYHFISPDQFQEMVERGEFLEHAQVFDNCYGTGAAAVEDALRAGELVLLEIDWQGARQVRARLPAARTFSSCRRRAQRSRSGSRRAAPIPSGDRSAGFKMPRRDIAHWSEFDYRRDQRPLRQAVEDLLAIVRERGDPLVAAARTWSVWRRICSPPESCLERAAAGPAAHSGRHWPGAPPRHWPPPSARHWPAAPPSAMIDIPC